jgi:hypothetical protein
MARRGVPDARCAVARSREDLITGRREINRVNLRGVRRELDAQIAC